MPDALATRVHRNLMEVSARFSEGAGTPLERHAAGLLFAGRSAVPFMNGVMREGPAPGADALLRRAREFFFGMGRGFVAYAWPGDPDLEVAALAEGMFPVLEHYPEMVCRAPLPELAGDLRPVTDVDEAAAYWEVCDASYPSLGLPEGLFAEAFAPEDLLNGDGVAAWLAFDGARAVAAASVFLAEGVGMIAWVAARPEVRGRGLAAACTVRATNAAFELGADLAALQASSMGEDLYRRLGYEELYSYRLLGAMPS